MTSLASHSVFIRARRSLALGLTLWALGCGGPAGDVAPDAAAPDTVADSDAASGSPQAWAAVTTEGERVVLQGGALTVELTTAPVGIVVRRGDAVVFRTVPPPAPAEFAAVGAVLGDTPVAFHTLTVVSADLSAPTFALTTEDGAVTAALVVRRVAPSHVKVDIGVPAGATAVGLTADIPTGRHWYGQGQLTDEAASGTATSQHFPLDAGGYERPRLLSNEGTNIVVPLWLTASGVALFHDAYSTLAVSFNRDANGRFRLQLLPEGGERTFALHLIVAEHTRAAYEAWVVHGFDVRPRLPVGARPPDALFARPIWTTWAQYKHFINQARVLDFARSIVANGYDLGVLEIDDVWTPEYGDLSFDARKFPDPAAMIAELHGLGAQVSLWVPPFVNETAASFPAAVAARALVGTRGAADYPPLVGWWNSMWRPVAGAVDFASDAGRAFWAAAIHPLVKSLGVDGFKYDGGEVQFLPENPDLGQNPDGTPRHPNTYPDDYARFAHAHHGMEVRAGVFAQDVPIAFRQFDKASTWGLDNGLAAVLTQYLMVGLVGYPFILPDMVGGNEYGTDRASDELFVRWVQLNAFLPMIQLSIVPWRAGFAPTTQAHTQAALARRATLVPRFLSLADEAARTQAPMVRPLFWAFPDDPETYAVGDQFLLGDDLLVAPVVTAGAVARRIYLPAGEWCALDTPTECHTGPVWLEGYPAPLERTPAFLATARP